MGKLILFVIVFSLILSLGCANRQVNNNYGSSYNYANSKLLLKDDCQNPYDSIFGDSLIADAFSGFTPTAILGVFINAIKSRKEK